MAAGVLNQQLQVRVVDYEGSARAVHSDWMAVLALGCCMTATDDLIAKCKAQNLELGYLDIYDVDAILACLERAVEGLACDGPTCSERDPCRDCRTRADLDRIAAGAAEEEA